MMDEHKQAAIEMHARGYGEIRARVNFGQHQQGLIASTLDSTGLVFVTEGKAHRPADMVEVTVVHGSDYDVDMVPAREVVRDALTHSGILPNYEDSANTPGYHAEARQVAERFVAA